MPTHPFAPSPHHSPHAVRLCIASTKAHCRPTIVQTADSSNRRAKSTTLMMFRLQKRLALFLNVRTTKAKLTAARRAAMFRHRCSIFSSSIKLLIFIFHDSQVIKCHEWVTFVSNTLSASRQRRCMCLGFLFNSCVGFHWCIPFYI